MIIRRLSRSLVIAPLVLAAGFVALGAAQNQDAPGDALVAGFKSTYPASVSDAVELVTGRNGTMRHDMKLMTGANLVGRAVTAIARPAPGSCVGCTLRRRMPCRGCAGWISRKPAEGCGCRGQGSAAGVYLAELLTFLKPGQPYCAMARQIVRAGLPGLKI